MAAIIDPGTGGKLGNVPVTSSMPCAVFGHLDLRLTQTRRIHGRVDLRGGLH